MQRTASQRSHSISSNATLTARNDGAIRFSYQKMITKTIDLRTRMVLLVILATLPITTVLIFQSVTVHRDNVSRVFSEATASALKIAAYPKEILPEPGRYLGNISRLQEMSRPEECASLLKLLDPVKKVQPYFTTVTIYLPNGNRICPVPEQGENANVADRKYFQDVIRTRSYAVSNLLLRRSCKRGIMGRRDAPGNGIYSAVRVIQWQPAN